MSKENSVAITHGMLGGTVDKMIQQVIGKTIECNGCREEFQISDSNLYGIKVPQESTDDVIRFPMDSEDTEWKIYIVCDNEDHSLRVDNWNIIIPSVTQNFPTV